MEAPTINVVFDRKKIATREKKGLVQVVVTYKRKRKFIGTGIKVYSGQFHNEQIILRSDSIQMNNHINSIITNIREIITLLYKNKEEFSFEKLERLIYCDKPTTSFIDFVEKRIDQRSIRESTKKQHHVMLNALIDFGKIESFSDITPKNIKLWDDYIKNKVNVQSSIYSYHKRLKTYINEAIQLEILKDNPYSTFQTPRGESASKNLYQIKKRKLNYIKCFWKRRNRLRLIQMYQKQLRNGSYYNSNFYHIYDFVSISKYLLVEKTQPFKK